MSRRRSWPKLCLAVAATALSCSPTAPHRATIGPGTPIIIISIDTLRADHLPAYGYPDVQTPHLDAFRRDSILYRNAYSNCPLTLPSHLSTLTGLLPQEHGVRNNIGFRFDGEKHPTLASLLKRSGYATGAAVSSYVMRGSTGIAGGFDFYEDGIPTKLGVAVGQLQRSGSVTAAVGQRWISTNAARPFFFFLHLFEPHYPYDPPAHLRARFPLAYDGEIAQADAIVGEFLKYLKQQDLYDRSLIVLMSDHGEGLNDHGEQEHGIFLYREALQVPLILKLPHSARGGETVARPVQLIDVFPTIAELLQLQAPARSHGQSLMVHGERARSRPIFSETIFPRIHLGWSELRSLIDDRHHFIQAPRPELYDLNTDPAERSNLVARQRRRYSAMRKQIEPYIQAVDPPAAWDREEAAKLAALGYLGSVPASAGGDSLPDPKDRIGEINEMIAASRSEGEKKYDQAIAAYQSILNKNPHLVDAWTKLAIVYEEIGDYAEAAGAYRKAIQIAPALASEYALSLASVLLKLDQVDEAEKYARFALDSKPAAAHLLLGRVAMARQQFSAAEKEAKAAASDPNYRYAALILTAEIYVHQKRLSEALSLLDLVAGEARQMSVGPIESLHLLRGDVLARLERREEAERAFREEIRFFPHHLQAYVDLAILYRIEGDPARAAQVLEHMAAANPTRRAYLMTAQTLEALDQPGRAAAWRARAQR